MNDPVVIIYKLKYDYGLFCLKRMILFHSQILISSWSRNRG